MDTPKAHSVTEEGEDDGWTPEPGWVRDLGPGGRTQLVVSVPAAMLQAVHADLVAALAPPLGVLYRQVVDRRDPQPEGAPPRDFVALDLPPERVVAVLRQHSSLIHHDARCELWVRGALGDQVILASDGLLYAQPDDPAFHDVLQAHGLTADVAETIADWDYVRHTFHADNDAVEDGLVATLGLVAVAHRG